MLSESDVKNIGRRKGLLATLLVTLLVSMLIGYSVYQLRERQRHRLQVEFEKAISETTTKITSHINAYEEVLKGARSLFLSSNDVTRSEWHSYVTNLELNKLYPGIQGVGFASMVTPAERPAYEKKVRTAGFPDFHIWPAGERDEYSAILYLEPFDWRNQRAFGYDMFSEPTRHEAMVRARDTGLPSLSGKVLLVQETDQAPQAGTLLYLPLYRKGARLDTVQQRRQALLGWVYSPYRMNNMLEGMLGETHSGIRLRVYDRDSGKASADDSGLLFDSDAATGSQRQDGSVLASRERTLKVRGRTWVLDFDAVTAFGESYGNDILYPEIVGLLLIGILLIALTWNLFSAQRRSLQYALVLSRSEKRLRAAQDKLSNTLNISPCIICAADLNSGHFTECNQTVSKILGYTVEEFVARPYTDLVHPDDLQKTAEEMARMSRGRATAHFENRVRCKDGTYKWLSWKATGADVAGRIYAVATDITEAREADAQLRQAQKMEALGTLVGGIAHEFNNALAGMTGNLYLARLKCGEQPDVVEKLNNIESLAFRSAELIKSLLSFARKDIVRKSRIDMPPFLIEALRLNEASLPENVRLSLDIRSNDAWVFGDANILQQVLLNLVNNARDAVADSDDPVISVGLDTYIAGEHFRVRHADMQAERYICLSVHDNGAGIDAETQGHIFDPFFTTKEVGKGTGLGLSMVIGAVQTHQGCVEVESSPGHGTVFRVYLPAIEAESREHKAQLSDVTLLQQGYETVLLVDDDVAMLDLGKEVLESLGYHVVVATDGMEALKVFADNADSIAVIITDVIMPRLGGVELIRRIRESRPDIRAIFTTAYHRKDERLDSLHTGNEVLLHKPYNIRELSHTIRTQLDGTDAQKDDAG